MKFVLGVNVRRPSARSTATSAPTFIRRVRWKISKSTNHSSDYVCDVIWRQRLRTTESFCHFAKPTGEVYWKSRIMASRFRFYSTSGGMFHRWPSFDLFLCSSIDMCGFDINMSGFVPVCTVRFIFRWFDCDLCKLNSFVLGSIHFWGVWITFWRFDYLCTSWIYLHEFRSIFKLFDWLFAVLTLCKRLSFYFWPLNNVCTHFILFILWLEDFGRNGTP